MQKYYPIVILLIFAVLLSGSLNTSTAAKISETTLDFKETQLNTLSVQNTINNVVTIIITGIVKTCTSGDPFEGVTITLKSLSGEILGTTTTDSNGFYTLIFQCTEDMLQSIGTTFQVTASYPGHISQTEDVTVTQYPNTLTTTQTDSTTSNVSNYYGNADFTLGELILSIGSWHCIGIDHSKPHEGKGPNATQVQVHVTNNASSTLSNLWARFDWTSGSNNLTLNAKESQVKFIGDLLQGQTVDVYWLTEAIRDINANGQIRNFTVTIYNESGTIATINDSLQIQTMIDQARNKITGVIAPSTVHNGDIFTVVMNASTSSTNYWQTYIPGLTYDPSIIKPLNYTITFTMKNGTTITTTDTNIQYSNATSYSIVWTYQAIGVGQTQIWNTIEDQTNPTNFHYNSADTVGLINITSNPTADVGVKTAIVPAACPGETISGKLNQIIFFQINATNYGPDTATNINITDILPSSVTYKDYSLSTDGGITWTLSKNLATSVYNNNTSIWNVGNLTKNSTSILMIRTTLKQNDTTLTNTANIAGNSTYDNNTANNNASSSVYVPA